MTADTSQAGRFIGAAIIRREDPRLLTGHGAYVDDVQLPGTVHGAFVRSPIARARITSVDVEPARAAPGVRAVLTAAEAMPLAGEEVRFVGDPVVLVVADTRALAEDAAELVTIEYEPLEPVLDMAAAVANRDDAVLWAPAVKDADVEQILASAHLVVTETMHQHRYLPVPMEPRGVVASWAPFPGEITVWISTQGAHTARDHLALALGLPSNQVRVIVKDVGGAFGQKIAVGREETSVVLAARLVGRPVKWIEDRWENLVSASHARAEQADVRLGLDADGTILAIHVDHIQDVGAHADGVTAVMHAFITGPYRFGKVAGTSAGVRTNTSTRGAYRGPWMFETVVRETMLDMAARRLAIDPLELRRRNVLQQSELGDGSPRAYLGSITPAETLEQAVAMLGYDDFRHQQAEARDEGRYLGVGIAGYLEPSAFAMGDMATDAVTIRVDTSGSVQVITGANSQGHSIETTMAQVVAQEMGVDIADIAFLHGDTAYAPVGALTGGSRNAVFGGGAARQAAVEMRERVIEIAAGAMEAAPDDLEIHDGVISVKGTPARQLTLREVAERAYRMPEALPAGVPPGLELTARFATGGVVTWSNATHVCTCEVDVRTGGVTLLRYIVSEDCGTMINPMVVEGQIAGGVVQGIGGTLLEHFVYDADGTPLTTTFLDYLLPTASDVPQIEFGHIETPSSWPGGFKGMGEGGAIASPAAVINAVNDALAPFGVAFTRQPLSPQAILQALAAMSGGGDL